MPFLRQKTTAIDTPLPTASELVGNRSTVHQYVDLDGVTRSFDFRELVLLDPMPVPMPVDREGYCSVDTSDQFWASGHGDWLNIEEAIRRYWKQRERTASDKIRVLDFGCATGRLLRHAWVFGKDRIDCWGCDFAPANVEWCKRHLNPELKIILNSDHPHLPFPDGYFDVVVGLSVFTHIDQFEDAWLLELRRITQPQGLLYLTVHNEATWRKVLVRPGCFEQLLRANKIEGNRPVDRALFEGDMPAPRIVFRMSKEQIYNCNVWLSNEYILDRWSRYFDVLRIADNAHTSYQSPVILRPLADFPREEDSSSSPPRPVRPR